MRLLDRDGRSNRGRGDTMAFGIHTRSLDVGIDIQRRLFTVVEYERMVQAGILAEDDRVELLDGEIVEMSPPGSAHAACVSRLNALFHDLFKGRAIVRVQDPIRLDSYSAPQPDLAVLKARDDFYSNAHPGPSDVIMLVEVADSSLKLDREIKLALYARAGIREAWLVDLIGQRVEVFTAPQPIGYQSHAVAVRGDCLSSAAVGADVLVGDILPPRI